LKTISFGRSLCNMMGTLDSELGTKHAKWDNDKLIYDVND